MALNIRRRVYHSEHCHSFYHYIYLILLLNIFIHNSTALNANENVNGNKKPTVTWIRPGTLSHQSLHSVLVSMEERLRGLENMKYTTNRLDLYLERFTRQLDSLDVRTRTVQIKLEQLEAVAQNIVTHELKNDLSTSHLHSKFETNQDRLIHKIGLTENRLDSSITKCQGTMDLGFEKSEKKQNDLEIKLNIISTEIEEISQKLMKPENLPNSSTNNTNNTKIIDTDIDINTLANMLKGIEKHVNKSIELYSEQSDSPNKPRYQRIHQEQLIREIIATQLHTETNKMAKKINNMYNDLWGKTLEIENLVKNATVLLNTSKYDNNNNDDDHTDLNAQDISCTETIQSVTEDLLGTLGSYLREKLETMDTNVEGMFASHKMLLGTYNKMREDSGKFETRLTYVLGKILDTMDNSTKGIDDTQLRIFDAIKSHNSQIVRTVAYNTNFLKKLTDSNGVEHKNIEKLLQQLLNVIAFDKNESLEYDDAMNESLINRKKNKKIKFDQPLQIKTDNQTSRHYQKSPEIKYDHHSLDKIIYDRNQHGKSIDYNNNNSLSLEKEEDNKSTINDTDDQTSDFDVKISPHNIEDENDKDITRLLMLYLKTLRGHLTKDKFLYEANPQQPYSSVQDMLKKLKELNYPSDFLKELEEWDHETNVAEHETEMDGEDVIEGKQLRHNHGHETDHSHSDDYDTDKDYLDYPEKHSN